MQTGGPSPAPVQRAPRGPARAGRDDAQAARERSVSPRPREPLPLRLKEYPRERRPSRAGFWLCNRCGDESQGRCRFIRDESRSDLGTTKKPRLGRLALGLLVGLVAFVSPSHAAKNAIAGLEGFEVHPKLRSTVFLESVSIVNLTVGIKCVSSGEDSVLLFFCHGPVNSQNQFNFLSWVQNCLGLTGYFFWPDKFTGERQFFIKNRMPEMDLISRSLAIVFQNHGQSFSGPLIHLRSSQSSDKKVGAELPFGSVLRQVNGIACCVGGLFGGICGLRRNNFGSSEKVNLYVSDNAENNSRNNEPKCENGNSVRKEKVNKPAKRML